MRILPVGASAPFLLAIVGLPLPRFDDPERGTLIVTNMSDNTATVIDLASRRIRATLPTGEGPHEAAASADGRWAVVTNYGARGKPGNSLTVIDLETATVARTIDLGTWQRPHGVRFLPGDTTLAVTSEASKAVVLVDFRAGTVQGSVSTDRALSHMLAVAGDGIAAVTTNVAEGSISVLDLARRPAPRVIPVAKQVEGVAIAPDGRQAWVGSNGDSIVVVIDLATARPVDTLRGFGMPYRLAVTPDGRRVVIADPVRAEVRIVDARSRRVQATVAIPADGLVPTAEVPGSPSPEGVALSADGKSAYVTLQGRNQVASIDLERGSIRWTLPVGVWPDGIAWAPPRR
jgi:DNA-binding beta-propeller fold protein YncE